MLYVYNEKIQFIPACKQRREREPQKDDVTSTHSKLCVGRMKQKRGSHQVGNNEGSEDDNETQ